MRTDLQIFQSKIPRNLAESVTFILEVPHSNFGQGTEYPDLELMGFRTSSIVRPLKN
jgi:hypothetical protein